MCVLGGLGFSGRKVLFYVCARFRVLPHCAMQGFRAPRSQFGGLFWACMVYGSGLRVTGARVFRALGLRVCSPLQPAGGHPRSGGSSSRPAAG